MKWSKREEAHLASSCTELKPKNAPSNNNDCGSDSFFIIFFKFEIWWKIIGTYQVRVPQVIFSALAIEAFIGVFQQIVYAWKALILGVYRTRNVLVHQFFSDKCAIEYVVD